MEVEILRDKLKTALNNCERITRKSLTLPILQNVLLKSEGNFLEITTTNLETTIKWQILAKVKKEGRVAVPATFLANLVSLIPAEKIILATENKNLVLTTKDQKIQVQGQDPEDFPLIPKIEKKASYSIANQKLNEALSQTVDIPSFSQIRPEISGIYFEFKKNKAKIVSTDSFRLAEKTIGLEKECNEGFSFILPQNSAREIANISGQQKGKVDIHCDPNQVLFEFSNQDNSHSRVDILSRLIEGEYPSYQEIIPKKYTSKIQIDKDLFETQIKQAGLFSGKILEVKLTTFSQKKKIRIFSQSPESGRNEAYLPAETGGEDIEVSFNYRFLLDGLQTLKSSEVVFELNKDEGPGVLKPVGDESYLYVLMPIKSS